MKSIHKQKILVSYDTSIFSNLYVMTCKTNLEYNTVLNLLNFSLKTAMSEIESILR